MTPPPKKKWGKKMGTENGDSPHFFPFISHPTYDVKLFGLSPLSIDEILQAVLGLNNRPNS
jgi:hypothetical protein